MTANRKKRDVKPALRSRAEFETSVGLLAHEIIIERETRNAMDAEISAIRDKYAPQLDESTKLIDDMLRLCQEYADANPDLIPADRKSIELTHAIVGYRTGQPSLKTLRGWTWDNVLHAMRDVPELKRFIKTKEEPDKAGMIRDRDQLVDLLPIVGCKIEQTETFYVEPKLEDQTSSVSVTETRTVQ